MTTEISNVQTLGDTRQPRKFPTSNMEFIQNYFGNFQGQNWRQPNTNNHGNLRGIPEMAVEIYNVFFSPMQFDNLLVPCTNLTTND